MNAAEAVAECLSYATTALARNNLPLCFVRIPQILFDAVKKNSLPDFASWQSEGSNQVHALLLPEGSWAKLPRDCAPVSSGRWPHWTHCRRWQRMPGLCRCQGSHPQCNTMSHPNQPCKEKSNHNQSFHSNKTHLCCCVTLSSPVPVSIHWQFVSGNGAAAANGILSKRLS